MFALICQIEFAVSINRRVAAESMLSLTVYAGGLTLAVLRSSQPASRVKSQHEK